MSFTLMLILALGASLAYVSFKALRLLIEQKEHATQLRVMHMSGQMQAQDSFTQQLCYSIGMHRLLEQEGSNVSKKWQKAFRALYPEEGPYWRFMPDEVAPVLQELGFTNQEAAWLVRWRAKHPEIMVTLALALLGGLPEAQAWGVAHNI